MSQMLIHSIYPDSGNVMMLNNSVFLISCIKYIYHHELMFFLTVRMKRLGKTKIIYKLLLTSPLTALLTLAVRCGT